MFKPYDNVHTVRVREMQALVLLSKGLSQTEAAEACGTVQAYVPKMVKKIEHCYKLKLTEGGRSNYRLTSEGLELAAQFEVALSVLEGKEDSQRQGTVNKLVGLKCKIRDIVELAESI